MTGESWGTRVLRQVGGTGEVGQSSWRGQFGQDNDGQDSHGRKYTTVRIEKTGQDSWDSTTKTGQPWQESQERTARTGQGQLGLDDQHRTNMTEQL